MKKNLSMILLLAGMIVTAMTASPKTSGRDWATYRNDSFRSGVTSDALDMPLKLRWTLEPMHPPQPAWSAPAEEPPRMHSDRAFQIVIAGDTLYFGSSTDNQVYAIDIETGETRWTFMTGGPVRFAPTVWNRHVYVGSDDGYVYCLQTGDGEVIWRYRAGPDGEKVLGNGRMISLWPVRTGVLIDGGVAYFGAGVFPYEGIYICALDTTDGSVIWKNDTIGDLAHELSYGGLSPHGYLLASKDILYVPSGRSLPAAFNRKNGEFLFYHPHSPVAKLGGTWTLLDGEKLIAGTDLAGQPAKASFEPASGQSTREVDIYDRFPASDMVLTPQVAYFLTQNRIDAIDRQTFATVQKELIRIKEELKPLTKKLYSLREEREYLKDTDPLNLALEITPRESQGISRKQILRQLDVLAGKIYTLHEEEKRLKASVCQWQYPHDGMGSLILTRNAVIAGGNDEVAAIDRATGTALWLGEVSGRATSLAAAGGKLFVSTDQGIIYCFEETGSVETVEHHPAPENMPYPEDTFSSMYAQAVETILSNTSLQKGFCLVLDCEEGRLAYELSKRSDLKIIGLTSDRDKLESARRHLLEAGVYGTKVVVESWELSDLPQYFANLIVSDKFLIADRDAASIDVLSEKLFRVLRPCGGVVMLGQTDSESNETVDSILESLGDGLRMAGAPELDRIETGGTWLKVTRGPLEGAGSWTHLYANPQHSANSFDELIKDPLGVLWFGEPGPLGMVERHARVPAPLAANGRMFYQGEESISAYDAYNGTFLWRRDIPGVVRSRVDVDDGNFAITDDGLFVAVFDRCYQLDAATGESLRVYEMPEFADTSPQRWAYIALDNGILFGSSSDALGFDYATVWKIFADEKNERWRSADEIPPEYARLYEIFHALYGDIFPVPDLKARRAIHREGWFWKTASGYSEWYSSPTPTHTTAQTMMTSNSFFAFDCETEKLLWKYRGRRISHISPIIANGVIYLLDSAITDEQRQQALRARRGAIDDKLYEVDEELGVDLQPEEADVRLLIALDATTGEKRWEKPLDLSGCGGFRMGSAYRDGLVLFFGQYSNHDTSLYNKGLLKWRRITALDAENGDLIWSRPLNYRRRPVVTDKVLVVEPNACSLRTGEKKMIAHPITGKPSPWEIHRGKGCGVISASKNFIFWRSNSTAMYDLSKESGYSLFGGLRVGCWLNIITADGLVLIPESSSGCTCSYPLRSSVALVHKPSKSSSNWTVCLARGETTPVKRLGINLGAPGDMKDERGDFWLGYPRPNPIWADRFGDYGIKFDLHVEFLQGMDYFGRNHRNMPMEKTNKPWLFSSGCIGLLKCELPLLEAGSNKNKQTYLVRLGFSALKQDNPGQRIFDVKIQDQIVWKDFDIYKAAGGTGQAVIKEFERIEVSDVLKIELIPKRANPTSDEAPIINFIEAIRETGF